MKGICLSVLLVVSLYALPAVAEDAAEQAPECEEGSTEPRCQFEFDDEGRIRTKSGKTERTFSFPPLKTGFLLDIGVPDFVPYVALQLFGFKLFDESFAFDIGGASSRIFLSLDWEAVPIMKLGPSIWGGWNVEEAAVSFGLGFTVLKF